MCHCEGNYANYKLIVSLVFLFTVKMTKAYPALLAYMLFSTKANVAAGLLLERKQLVYPSCSVLMFSHLCDTL